jgi:uncharacterized protein YbjQ (UPF0145 family)
MRISSTETIEGGRVLYSIGTIRASSAWHAKGSLPHQSDWQESVKADLIRKAEDLYADAIIDVNYQVDHIVCIDGGFGIKRQRILATATAVKLSSQA